MYYCRPTKPGSTDCILALRLLVERRREFPRDACSLCRSHKGVWFGALQDTLGSSAPPWDSCRDYRTTLWPVLREWRCCEVWWGHVQLLFCAYGSEAGIRPYSITFQYMYGLGTGQSCGPKSLWSICQQHQDHWSCFCRGCNQFLLSLEVLVMALKALHEEVKPLGLRLLGQN